jgi:hypothetical protein
MQIISRVRKRWFYWVSGWDTFAYLLFLTLFFTFQNTRFVSAVSDKARRFLLVHFRKRHVERQGSVRKGTCHRCGACCNLVCTCPMLTRQGSCLVYGKCRPQSCKAFPIDGRDIQEMRLCGVQCGYFFESKDKGRGLMKTYRDLPMKNCVNESSCRVPIK